ncbi:hypothetical protein N864_05820 [Intrasporangium chromatireducens Q5-1]|uniref:Phage tail tape measure protein domain-containing protein n=1 Tax=Intrasporangium chromatireducens Q5-1 TaxID=584657 RepID=W9GI31_9MICO|nr:phage tail tape measure protein [Intrasporangium chromatireducens]EWT04827.1 hypothetical protein N864_05820 [Intrasporangium chromatireducens Q5-1]
MVIRSVVVKYAADMTDLLKGLDDAAKANERLAASSNKTGDHVDQASKRTDKMAAAGLGVALAVGGAIAKFAEFDATMSQVAAATGATGAAVDSLRDAAVRAGADTQYSATEAAQGVTELAKAGVSTSDIIGGGLTGALNLAAAGQIDVADAAEIAATAMTQFQLKGDQVSHVADLLAAGANKAQGGVGDLGMALKQSGLVASQMGLSVEETTTALTMFASAGLIGSDAGTSFKTMLQRLAAPTDEAKAKMDELGITAYDANGQFIGLEAVAGKLTDGMARLDPATRNAAMATIFGSDAIRAANVLYTQGAQGVRTWSGEVNQSGYAMRQAATLTDNLKGDIERLGGSFETVLIKSGSGANDTLRMLTGTAENVVNAVGQIPGPVLLGAAAFTSLALVGPKVGRLAQTLVGPLRSGVGSFTAQMRLAQAAAIGYGPAVQGAATQSLTAAQKFRTAATAAAAASGGLKGAAGGLMGMLGGPWGMAMMGAVAGLTAYANAQANAEAAAKSFSATLDEQTGKLTAASYEDVLKRLQENINKTDWSKLEAAGVDFSAMTAAIAEGGPKLDAYRASFDKLRKAAESGALGSEAMMLPWQQLGNAIQAGARDADGGRLAFQQTKDTLDKIPGAAQGAADGIDGVGGSASGAVGPAGELAGAADGIQSSAKEAEQALKDLADAIMGLGGPALDQRAAERDFQAAIDDVTQSLNDERNALIDARLKKLGITEATKAQTQAAGKWADAQLKATDRLNADTEAGRRNESALDALVKKTQAKVVADFNAIASTKGTEEATKAGTAAMQKGRDEFIKAAVAAGKTKDEAKALADKLKLIPSQVPILVQQTGADAAAAKIDYAARTRYAQIIVTERIQRQISQTDMSTDRINRRSSAYGNIFKAYAAGGVESHVPQIASGDVVRIWNEPETGGESYIPHANDWRRPRAKAILAQTADILGMKVVPNAVGNMYGAGRPVAGVAPMVRVDSAVGIQEWRAVTAALSDLTARVSDLGERVEAGAARGTAAGLGYQAREIAMGVRL